MNKIAIWFSFVTFFFFGLYSAPIAKASILAKEHIQDYQVEFNIGKNGKVHTIETIVYDFANSPNRHGIYRAIDFIKENSAGKKFKLNFTDVDVVDENGNRYRFDKSSSSDQVNIKIGDANKIISGIHTYVISYTVSGAITYFSDHDEFYWNVIGTNWSVPIANAAITLQSPLGGEENKYSFICYTGKIGSFTSDCNIEQSKDKALITSTRILQVGEGLTVVAGFPINITAHVEPEPVVPFFETMLGRIVLVLGFLLFIWWYILYPFVIAIKWYYFGRDPYIGANVTAYFEAPELKSGRHLTPAETGGLIDEIVHERDVFASVLDLARRGYLQIIEKKKEDLYLEKKDTSTISSLLPFEKNLLLGLFKDKKTIRIKDENLYSLIVKTKQDVYAQLVIEGFFKTDPSKTRSFYNIITGIALFTFNLPVAFSAFLFGRAMPKKTFVGAREANKVKGLINFIKSQERKFDFASKQAIDYQLSPQFLFEQFLAYAVAFGIEKKWIDRFSNYKLTAPMWYQTYDPTFTARSFSQSLNVGTSSFRSSATSTSSSSGFSSGFSGGSSGGGGGGGGGGSW